MFSFLNFDWWWLVSRDAKPFTPCDPEMDSIGGGRILEEDNLRIFFLECDTGEGAQRMTKNEGEY